jgi:hypothetical protein
MKVISQPKFVSQHRDRLGQFLNLAKDQLTRVQRGPDRATAGCPAHEDEKPSLSIGIGREGRILLKCFAGCDVKEIVKALGLTMRDLRDTHQAGCTLRQYAKAKALPEGFLRDLGLSEITYGEGPAVRIPYRSVLGDDIAIQFRVALTGPGRLRWKRGTSPVPYGLDRLKAASQSGAIVLVEGPSDAHTLWYHKVPALGLPSAASWKPEWDQYLVDIPRIYVVIEPDVGGEAVLRWLATASFKDRVWLLRFDRCKDPSDLHVASPKRFLKRWRKLHSEAVALAVHENNQRNTSRQDAWRECSALAQSDAILDEFGRALKAQGLVGERTGAKLLYLALTSRLLGQPVSCAIKGPSAAGKNHLVKCVLQFFPPSAYYECTAMSERALVYGEEPLEHRFLILFEVAGLRDGFMAYAVRSLLSERRLIYETVVKTPQGLKSRRIERNGPTGLLTTTTAVRLHAENETRLLSIPITDTADQTKRVMQRQGRAAQGDVAKGGRVEPWIALQRWLSCGGTRVIVPFGEHLAELVPPTSVRLRRDFPLILTLIQCHALLHRRSRFQTKDGAIEATHKDYAVVRRLTARLISEGVEATVPRTVREAVAAVKRLRSRKPLHPVRVTAVAQELQLDKGSALRRIQDAIDRGYLRNQETHEGRPARLTLGQPLPEKVEILPTVEALEQRCKRESAGRRAFAVL